MEPEIAELRIERNELRRSANMLRAEIGLLHGERADLRTEIRLLRAEIIGLRMARDHLTNTTSKEQQ